MNQDRTKRKLTAIFSADVVGYTRLMETDEAWTIKNLDENKKLVGEFIREYGGRVIDAIGDNLLAEFSSIINSVECAVKIQQELKKKNDTLVEDRRMHFRIGVNLGDVVEEDGRIYGSGVNIASRLEGLAEPGGICISGRTYDHIKTKLGLGYKFLGEHNVKNISDPIRIYRLLMDSENAGKIIGEKKAPSRASLRIAVAAVIILIIIAAGLTGWLFYSHQPRKMEPASIKSKKEPIVSDVEGGLKAIAVLPFEDLSPQKDQKYFADGIAEELLNALTRISELEVRGRTSSFSFKGKDVDLPTISKMLDVEYILEGSVRKAGEQVRITAQLINTRRDAHIWSETYERTMNDIFAIQDDISQSIADALQITLRVGELGRAPGMTSNVAAYDAYLAGCSLSLLLERENSSQAIEQLEKAVALDPDFAIGWNALAFAYSTATNLWVTERAEEFAAKAKAAYSHVVELIPETDLALRIAASRSGDMVEMERLYKKVLSLNPADYNANVRFGSFLYNMGRPTEAIEYFKRLVRREPLDSLAHFMLGASYEISGNIDAAAISFKKARELTNQPFLSNAALMILALEENNRVLMDEYLALVIPGSDPREINRVMQTLLDTPEDAVAKLRLCLTDPTFNNFINRRVIAVWASYFEEHELALQAWESIGSEIDWTRIEPIWRPIHQEMRQLPEFKDFVQEIGLVDYWRTSGNWGDFCHPIGDDDFVCD